MVRRTLLLLAVAVAAPLVAAAWSWGALVGGDGLSYSVVSRAGRVTASVSDARRDEHTVWLIVSDAAGRRVGVVISYGAGDDGPGVNDSASADMSLDPGTYRYGVYDADGALAARAPEYWTAEHRVASGQLRVQ